MNSTKIAESTHMLRVFVETSSHKVFEGLRPLSIQLWRIVLGNEEQHFHGMEVGMWWLSVGQLDGCDTQRPDVRLREAERVRG